MQQKELTRNKQESEDPLNVALANKLKTHLIKSQMKSEKEKDVKVNPKT